MGYSENARCARMRIALVLAGIAMAFALMGGATTTAFAQPGSLTTAAFSGSAQAEIANAGTVTVTTDADGDAYLKLVISEAGIYSMASTSSSGVDCDTYGYLYDASKTLLAESDDCHADTNFCITSNLAAGTYYLNVTGKECQQGATISVSVQKGSALNSLDYRCEYAADDSVSKFELGTWVQGEKTEWQAVDPAAYTVIGYVDRSVFIHAQESGAVPMLAWKAGLPKERGRFVVMASAVGGAYIGDAYYNLDELASSTSIAELDPSVTISVCGAIASVELGKYTTVPTNWSTRWDAITAGYYEVVGYCARSKFEALGGDEASISWTKGLPRDVGEYVVKCAATDVDENPYTGSCYVWASIEELNHAGSGEWIVDKKATYSEAGERHLVCAHCGAPCDYTTIPALKNSLETAGSGATFADYKILSADTVRYEACLSTSTVATVPDTVTIEGVKYKVVSVAAKAFAGMGSLKSVKIGKNVTSIGKNAFKGCKALKTLTVQTAKLKAAGVKGCLSGSSVTTVKVPKAQKKAYAKLFTKKGCGKKVTVK